LGATMAESSARNGTMGFADLGPRTLSESDITGIRELYGSRSEEEVCCAMISGKLVTNSGRPGKELEVWAEETASGRVVAQADTGSDGGFRIGGLSGGDYSVYWKTKDTSSSAMGELGTVSLESGESTVMNGKVAFRSSDISMQYLGRNGQLADHGIPLNPGRTLVINLGGRNLDDASAKISFSSPLIKVAPFLVTTQEFDDGISGISFMITVEPDITPGDYSVFVTGKNGPISCLIGALSVE